MSTDCQSGLTFLPIQHCSNVSTKETDVCVHGGARWKMGMGGGVGVQEDIAPQVGGQSVSEASYFSLNIKNILCILLPKRVHVCFNRNIFPPLPLTYLQSKTNRSGGLKPADLPKLASLLEEPCFPNAFGYSPVHHPRASNRRGSWRETNAKMGMRSGSQAPDPSPLAHACKNHIDGPARTDKCSTSLP